MYEWIFLSFYVQLGPKSSGMLAKCWIQNTRLYAAQGWLVSQVRLANGTLFLLTSKTNKLKHTHFLKNHTETLISTQKPKRKEADTPLKNGLEPDLRPAVARSVTHSLWQWVLTLLLPSPSPSSSVLVHPTGRFHL